MTNKRLIAVGEDPGSVPGSKALPLYPYPDGASGNRLRLLMGLSKQDYLVNVARINLFHSRPAGWSVPRARGVARMYRQGGLLDNAIVLLVGRKVVDAFFPDGDLDPLAVVATRCRPLSENPTAFVHVPHPSGRNRWYNDEKNERAARRLLSDMVVKSRDPAAVKNLLSFAHARRM